MLTWGPVVQDREPDATACLVYPRDSKKTKVLGASRLCQKGQGLKVIVWHAPFGSHDRVLRKGVTVRTTL
jgi:hypothetical protein